MKCNKLYFERFNTQQYLLHMQSPLSHVYSFPIQSHITFEYLYGLLI